MQTPFLEISVSDMVSSPNTFWYQVPCQFFGNVQAQATKYKREPLILTDREFNLERERGITRDNAGDKTKKLHP